MWNTLLIIIALIMMIKGFLIFITPNTWISYVKRLSKCSTKQMRYLGLFTFFIGALLMLFVYLVKGF